VDIRVDPIPDGSYRFRIWTEDRAYGDPIDLTGLLSRVDETTAEVESAHGRMPPEALILIGLQAWNLGFRVLTFACLKGTKATHYADYVRSDETFDFYRVDLGPRIAEYLNMGAT